MFLTFVKSTAVITYYKTVLDIFYSFIRFVNIVYNFTFNFIKLLLLELLI